MSAQGARSTLHVLVVDDEPDVFRKVFAGYWPTSPDGSRIVRGEREYIFQYVTSPDAAWNLLRFSEVDVDAVCLDVRFPGHEHDGFWLLKNIVQMTTDLPVIMLTKTPEYGIAHEAGYLRADRFFPKNEFLDPECPKDVEYLLNELDSVELAKRQKPELHDRKHLVLADEFASAYESTEQEYPATVAYYLFENELIAAEIGSLREATAKIRICDIGCGTGRVEELIARAFSDWSRETIDVAAVDFSGRMLRLLRDKELRPTDNGLTLIRASAERMECLDSQAFDFVVMGFGVPSYTKNHLSIAEAGRICRTGGIGLFSVYNEQSAFYEANRQGCWKTDADRPIAAFADPESGSLKVGRDEERESIACETFTEERLRRLLERNGWKARSFMTFPTLHVTLPRSAVEAMPDARSAVPGFPLAREFSRTLYDLDVRLSKAHPGFGHYLVATAVRK